MKHVVLSLVFIFAALFCYAQNEKLHINKRIRYSLVAGAAKATFDFSIPAPDFPTLELRLGGGLLKPLSRNFEIKTGLTLCMKVKRESYLQGSGYTLPGFPFYRIDEMISKRNHFALEVPLMAQYNILQTKVGIRAGVNGRFWMPDNDDVDDLTWRPEVGWLLGGTIKIAWRLSLLIDYYSGITNITTAGFSSSGNFTYYEMKNNYIQASLEYRF